MDAFRDTIWKMRLTLQICQSGFVFAARVDVLVLRARDVERERKVGLGTLTMAESRKPFQCLRKVGKDYGKLFKSGILMVLFKGPASAVRRREPKRYADELEVDDDDADFEPQLQQMALRRGSSEVIFCLHFPSLVGLIFCKEASSSSNAAASAESSSLGKEAEFDERSGAACGGVSDGGVCSGISGGRAVGTAHFGAGALARLVRVIASTGNVHRAAVGRIRNKADTHTAECANDVDKKRTKKTTKKKRTDQIHNKRNERRI
jgi:hypothetical protein